MKELIFRKSFRSCFIATVLFLFVSASSSAVPVWVIYSCEGSESGYCAVQFDSDLGCDFAQSSVVVACYEVGASGDGNLVEYDSWYCSEDQYSVMLGDNGEIELYKNGNFVKTLGATDNSNCQDGYIESFSLSQSCDPSEIGISYNCVPESVFYDSTGSNKNITLGYSKEDVQNRDYKLFISNSFVKIKGVQEPLKKVELYSITGSLVKQKSNLSSNNGNLINLSGLPKGTYIIKVESIDGYSNTEKLVY